MQLSRGLRGLLLVLLIPLAVSADPRDLDLFTSFEPGTPPSSGPLAGVTFTGGGPAIIGVPALYHSGFYSYRVPAGVTTIIDFDTPASVLELFALDQGTPDAVIEAFDSEGLSLGTVNLTDDFSSPMGDFSNPLQFTGVSQITVSNPGGGVTWLDDFGFTAAAGVTGDYNNNGVVDSADYTLWLDNLGAPAGTLPNDADGGVIGLAQYNTWKANLGAGGGSASENIPEPATWLMVLLAAILPPPRRR